MLDTPNRDYRYVLVESSSLEAVAYIKNAKNKKYDSSLNRPGSASFTLSLEDDLASEVIDKERVRGVIIYCKNRDGNQIARWSGYINTISINTSSNSIEVSCVGWYQSLYHRETKNKMIFNETKATSIAQQLLRSANNTSVFENVVNNGSFEVDMSSWTLPSLGFSHVINNDWQTNGGYSTSIEIDNDSVGREMLSTEVDVIASQRYAMYCDVYPKGNDCELTVEVNFYWYDASGSLNHTNTYPFSFDESTSSPTFITYANRSIADDVTAKVGLNFTVTGGSDPNYSIALDNFIFAAVDNDETFFLEEELEFCPTFIGEGSLIGSIDDDISRTFVYEKNTSYATLIDQLVDIESGFDWHIDPETREFNTYFENIRGTIFGRGSYKSESLFAYNWGPRNIKSASISSDMSTMSNKTSAIGKFGSGVAFDLDSVRYYGLFESNVTASDVVDLDVLAAYAGAETAYRLRPFKTYTFEPKPFDGDSSSLLVFDDYDIGDIVPITIVKGPIEVHQQLVRIFSFSISIDENGNEFVSSITTVSK